MKTLNCRTCNTRKRVSRSAKVDRLELYHVIVQCTDESEQRHLFERLKREGYLCRVVVL